MDEEFQPFDRTYKAVMFSLTLAMIYPNPATERWRLWSIPLLLFTVLPLCVLLLFDIKRQFDDGNTLEVIRHIAIIGPFLMGVVKRYLLYHKRDTAKSILDIINRDYASYNSYSEDDKRFIKGYIKNTKTYQYIWIACVMFILSSFVLTTTFINMYEYLLRSEPERHMIYDINLPYREPGAQLESPYFEILTAYLLYVALIYVINFTGYDGFMITAINHACMRIELYCRFINESMKYQGKELKKRMATAINDQVEIFKLIEMCQSTFNIYLGITYLSVTADLCLNLFLMTEGYKFDYQFTSFSLGTILHIYVPCRIADKLRTVSDESSTAIYCCGWENMYDLSVRRYIPFMIARAQTKVALKAFGIIIYQMDLFVSTMKTAYSMYTLIKTR